MTAAKKAQSREARAARASTKTTARKAKATKPAGARRKSAGKTTAPARTSAIRQWATENGHTVSTRGRIPAAVLQAYTAAH
ncbi:Lsr2 family DNA-binding protein [Mycolicibacterium confluentis]|uniref:Lsr2 family DNA-binding protein n=1 Tax=Mycolicibacterium confluentis TaxID=28047 RepID=UPI003B3A867E